MKHRWRYLSSCARTASVTASGRWPVFRTPMPPVKSTYSLPSTSTILWPFAWSMKMGVPVRTDLGMYSSRSLSRSSALWPFAGMVSTSPASVQFPRRLRELRDDNPAALAVQVLEVGQRVERDLRRNGARLLNLLPQNPLGCDG